MTVPAFPEPGRAARQTSQRLVERLGARIDANDGWLDFESFMQMALYEPGLGYYSAGSTKLGSSGDFTTAPELGDWLAEALGGFIGQVLCALGTSRLLELGAGTGRLADALIASLDRRGLAPIDYAILEPSADLSERQRSALAGSPGRVSWLETLPAAPLSGVMLANEVVDALPVARFVKRGGNVLPLGVRRDGGHLCIAPGPADARLSEAVRAIERRLERPFPDGYRSEVCLRLGAWLAALSASIDRGGVLLIDYGLPRRDYYSAARVDGTLICHYRQRAHGDALLWPGLQDLSAWVDFSAVADAARAAGFEVSGFTTQAQFLLEAIAADAELSARLPSPAAASALKTLVLPGEMGERFKLIWLTKGFDAVPLPGRDFRNWL